MKKGSILILSALFSFCNSSCFTRSQTDADSTYKIRTIITTDGEVDDMDSFIRLLLYSNEFAIEGLIYSSSQWHYAGDGKGTLFTSEMPSTAKRYGQRTDLRWAGIEWMQNLIDKYAICFPNLVKHDKNYPKPEYLKSIVRVGNIDFEGEMSTDTEGSNFIKNILLDNKPGPVYVQIWGGTNTLARALKSIENEYKSKPGWQDIYRKVTDKTFIYTILDQDVTYTRYIAPNWPEIKVIYNSAQFWSFAYMWSMVVPDTLKHFMSGTWFKDNIVLNHGPLLENYFTWGDGKKISGDPEHNQGDPAMAKQRNMPQYSFISEGDSPAYFFMLKYGLRSLEDPSFGGLGGRFIQSASNSVRWEDGKNVTDLNPYTGKQESSYPQIRWIEVLQNDFAARADWCVQTYGNANHGPSVKLKHENNLIASAGETVLLAGEASDPDGDQLSYTWWQYREAGSSPAEAIISDKNSPDVSVVISSEIKPGQTIHVILEVKDSGEPALTRFQRVIITIK